MIFPTPEFSDEVMSAFGNLIRPRLRDNEDIDDVLAGSMVLAARRADLLSRPVIPLDAEYTLAMWCWWPLKPEVPTGVADMLYERRMILFAGAASEPYPERFAEIPDHALTLDIERLYELQRAGDWPNF